LVFLKKEIHLRPIFDKFSRDFLSQHFYYFLCFLISNSIIAYGHLTLELKLLVAVSGVFLPFFTALKNMSDDFSLQTLFQEFLPASVLKFIFIPILLIALFFRFFHLTTLLGWPRTDDSLFGFVAWKLSQHWNWNLFHLFTQNPSGYIWGLALFFKGFGVSLETLFLFPAVLTFLTVGIGYWACVRLYSKSFSILISIILASSFWDSYWGRFSQFGALSVPYEILTLSVLGVYFKSSIFSRRIKTAIFLGLLTAGGFYLAPNWIVCAFF
jgi:hypothetical protein